MVQADPSQCVVQVAAPVGGEHHDGRAGRSEGAELRDGDGELPQELEQQRLEFVVGAVDLVDEQDGGSVAAMADAAQDRAFEEILLGVQVGLGGNLAARFGEPDREQLTLVVPVVEGLGDRQSLVALQPDQRATEDLREDLRCGGLADPGFALEQQWSAQRDREVDRGGGA